MTLAGVQTLGLLASRGLLAVALLLVAALVGHALLPTRLRPRKAVPAVAFGLSFGLLATAWLSWVAAVWLGTWAVAAVWAALVLAAAPGARPFARDLRRVTVRLWSLLRATPVLGLALAAALAVLVPALALPLVDSDGIRYQVAHPRLALLTGSVETYRWDVTGYFPQVGSMLYLVATALGGGETCKLAHAAIAVAAGGVLGLLVHRGRRAGGAARAAPLLLLTAPLVAAPATAAFLDHFALFHLATATLLVAGGASPAAAGLALGAALGTKLTAAPAVLGLAVAAWLAAPRRGRTASLAAVLGAAALAYLPFAIRCALETGDPFYPLGLGVLSRPLPGITAAGLQWAVDYRAAPRGLLAIGWFHGQPGTAWDDVVGPWALLALLAVPVIAVERRARVLLALVIPSLAVAALWHPPGRYFLPLFWALAAILATALARVLPRIQRAATLLLAATALVPAAPALLSTLDAWPHLRGAVSRDEVLARHVPGYRAARFVATQPGGTVMALDFPGPYYFDRPWIVEGVLNEPPLAAWVREGAGVETLLARLRSLDVRHLVVTPGYGGGSRWSLLALARGDDQTATLLALRSRLRLLATVDGVDVYEVPP